MIETLQIPRSPGQLVWCPADPSLGIGLVMAVESSTVRVRFGRLEEERIYTTRGKDLSIARYEIRPGEQVVNKDGESARVLKRVGADDEGRAIYEMDDGEEVYEYEILPEVRDVGAKERLASLNLAHPEVVRGRMQGLELAQVGRRPGQTAILGARVQWLPYQIDVATRAVGDDPVRLLLADEVGLGKTVEAALIYAGLRQEGRAERVLILTPESLSIQWLGEIYRKVHEVPVLLDEERIEDAYIDYPELGPFEGHQRIVTSIDLVSGDPSLAEAAANASWDLVIVDEAHHLRWSQETGGNAAYQLVEALAENTHNLLLLTATPMALDPAEYHALLRLLDPERFDDPGSFDEVTERVAAIRDVARELQIAVDEEKEISKEVIEGARELLADDPDDIALFDKFLAQKLQSEERETLSEEVLDALRDRHGLAEVVVRNRRGPVGGMPDRHPQTFALEPSPLQAVLIEVGEGVIQDLMTMVDDPAARYRHTGEMLRALWATPKALTKIIEPFSPELAKELQPYVDKVLGAPFDSEGLPTGDMRLRWLAKTVREVPEGDKVLVFVESGIAAKALKGSLSKVLGADVAIFHRGLSPRDQDRQVAWFRDVDGPQVMVSTEAGGEGRNFQFCHHVVLYDLPWRPATIEQRIGRVDRVGQKYNVNVLVPYFRTSQSRFEAAILKIMQEAIGVLDRTVGGIDSMLEYVSDGLARLVLEDGSAEDWMQLYQDVYELVAEARERIESAVDPVLDFASFSAERAAEITGSLPPDLETQTENFISRYADQGHLKIHPKTADIFDVEGAPGAATSGGSDSSYTATFSRMYALDHEDVEFISFGHPLFQDALEWAKDAHEASAALALARGFKQDGAIFLWRFGLNVPVDIPEAAAYFNEHLFTVAVDEAGKRLPRYEGMLDDADTPLERMDHKPLKASVKRWSKMVDGNFAAAEEHVYDDLDEARKDAKKEIATALERRRRFLLRRYHRALSRVEADSAGSEQIQEIYEENQEALEDEYRRIERAVNNATPHLHAVIAVRLMKTKLVSA